MSLPGKLCVGILEEDNPLRSYFRFKPLLLDEGGRYVPFEDGRSYPDEGCIRIVPDKNESYHFKMRMRQMGLFCVVDLREHPNDNDKIRPNKNYRPEGEEINACIIYSDVVRTPAPGMIFELLPADAAQAPVATPRTSMVLLEKDEAVEPACHTWEAAPDAEGRATLRSTPAMCPVEELQVFELPGFREEKLRFAIRTAGSMKEVCDLPERPEKPEKSEKAEKTEKFDKIEKIEKPERAVKPAEPQPASAEKPAPEKPAEKPAEKPEEPPKAEPEAPAAPEPEGDKPWIHHDASMVPKPVNPHLSRAEQLRAAQAGLNPRRGRSLQELIDEKWQASRLNQLGMSASPIVTGAPVRNPVDVAVEALKEAWGQPDMRASLLDAVSQVGDFKDSLRQFREQAGLNLVEAQLDQLEAQRLKLLSDLDKLKAGGSDIREQLKQEIRRDEADALAEAVEKTRAAREQQAKYEQMASDARAAAKDARNLLDELSGEQLEQKIRDVALIRRINERMAMLRGADEGETIPAAPEKIDINAFIDRLMQRAEAEGWALSRADAANLCVCLTLSPTLMLSGAPGSGKTTMARMLADALGISASGRAPLYAPEPRPVLRGNRVKRMLRCPEAPAMVILDDANLCPAPDALRGMAQVYQSEWRTVLTLQDAHSGMPMNAATLNRGFLVRLSAPANLPWKPVQRLPAPEYPLTSIQAILRSLPQADLPSVIVERMNLLRDAMARRGAVISRRALDDAWRYCAAMLVVLGEEANANRVFDMAVAQRILPGLLACAPIEAVMEFRQLTRHMPVCQALLRQPLPVALG
ncbi:MAG: hypothetical protein IJH86_08535 [Clostridia bacterium]|nr:hypothetical protein [Clostridia bacterium]